MKKKTEEKKQKGREKGIRCRKAAVLLAACILAAFSLTGCGASAYDNGASEIAAEAADSSTSNASYAAGGAIYEEATEIEDAKTESDGTGIMDDRKLIQTVGLEVETQEFEQIMSALESQVQELGGYIERMDTYNGSSYSEYVNMRHADLAIRIPSERLNGFLQTVSDISNIVRRYDNVEDVTLSYVDMESRRNTLRTEQSRLLEFLDKAESVEEIIALEERLSEVRYQLESMESQLRTIDNLVEYSTVNISISEVRELTVIIEEEPSVWERTAGGFMESLRSIGNGIVEVCIWFVVHIPYLVIWAVVITGIVLACKKYRRMRLKKKEEKNREAEARMQEQKKWLQEWEAGQAAQKAGGQDQKQD